MLTCGGVGMNRNVILHNPRCSKSRQTLALLEEKGVKVEVVEYLKTPPAKADLKFICSKLGVTPIEIIRTKEDVFRELGLSMKDERSSEEWIDLMVKNPVLIERPIVVYNQKAAVGRPPENVLNMLFDNNLGGTGRDSKLRKQKYRLSQSLGELQSKMEKTACTSGKSGLLTRLSLPRK